MDEKLLGIEQPKIQESKDHGNKVEYSPIGQISKSIDDIISNKELSPKCGLK